MRRLAELAAAFMLLTRLPVARLAAANPPPRDCLWAYPLVGAALGAIGAATHTLALYGHLGRPQAAILAIAATALATGALHEDGLADTADGLGGGRTRARKLEIMRDSQIGTYGTLALLLVTALRIAALAESTHPGPALILAGLIGRGAMLVPVVLLPPARPDGLAATLAGPAATTGLALTAASGLASPAALLAACLPAAAMAWLMQRQIAGYTGDTLGATEQLAECAALLAT